jgi:hypothetical protein
MSFDEVFSLLKADGEQKKDAWERTRQQCFYSVLPYSKIKSPDELFTLPWDKKAVKKPVKKLTKKQLENRIKEAERWLKK